MHLIASNCFHAKALFPRPLDHQKWWRCIRPMCLSRWCLYMKRVSHCPQINFRGCPHSYVRWLRREPFDMYDLLQVSHANRFVVAFSSTIFHKFVYGSCGSQKPANRGSKKWLESTIKRQWHIKNTSKMLDFLTDEINMESLYRMKSIILRCMKIIKHYEWNKKYN